MKLEMLILVFWRKIEIFLHRQVGDAIVHFAEVVSLIITLEELKDGDAIIVILISA